MTRYFFTVLLLVISVSLPIALSTQETSPVQLAEESPETEAIEEREPLKDIAGHWAEAAINNLYQTHVVNGYQDGNFGPNDAVTRTQFLVIILRAFNYDLDGEEYADFAYSVGIINNLDLWKNHGDDHVSRGEALKILLNAGNLEAGTLLTPNFQDVDIVNDWFAVYSAYGKAQSIILGDRNGNFNGKSEITRAETCVLTVRVMERQPSEVES